MIEINLSPTKKKGGEGVLLDLLNKINVKMMVVAILLYFVPDLMMTGALDTELENVQKETRKTTAELRGLNNKIRELKKIEGQIDALKKYETRLSKRLEVVKQIINTKQSPFSLLRYIADNTPKNVWLSDIFIDGNKLEIRGFSSTWKSIGSLIENLKNSIFFDKTVKYSQPKQKDPRFKKWDRKEYFLIRADIVRFE